MPSIAPGQAGGTCEGPGRLGQLEHGASEASQPLPPRRRTYRSRRYPSPGKFRERVFVALPLRVHATAGPGKITGPSTAAAAGDAQICATEGVQNEVKARNGRKVAVHRLCPRTSRTEHPWHLEAIKDKVNGLGPCAKSKWGKLGISSTQP